jgi:Flp pilus assembly pilin Flp
MAGSKAVTMLKRIGRKLRALHRDEQGADMVEYILIVAAVALPLLGVMIWFWKDLSRWVGDAWEVIKGGGGEKDPSDL